MEKIRRLFTLFLLGLRLRFIGSINFNPKDPMIEMNKIIKQKLKRFRPKSLKPHEDILLKNKPNKQIQPLYGKQG